MGGVFLRARASSLIPTWTSRVASAKAAPFPSPEGPSTQYLRPLVQGMDFGTRVLKCWVLGPFGLCFGTNGNPFGYAGDLAMQIQLGS